MRPEERDPAYMYNIVQAAEDIAGFLKGVSYAQYLHDVMRQAAVERKLEVIGEAVRKLSDTFRGAHPEIPASKIIAMRNILAHRYYTVDHEIVWHVASVEVPAIAKTIAPLIPPLPLDPDSESTS